MSLLLLGAGRGTAGGFSPADLPGLEFLLDPLAPGTHFFTDAGSTPATADGDNVHRWAAVAGDVPYLQRVARNPLKLRVENGVPVAESLNDTSAIVHEESRTIAAMSLHIATRSRVAGTTGNAFFAFTTGQGSPSLAVVWATGGLFTGNPGFNSGGFTSAHLPTADGVWHTWSFVYDGGAALFRVYLDGVEYGAMSSTGAAGISGVPAPASVSITAWSLGYATVNQANRRYAGVALYDAAQTPEQVAQVHQWMRGRYAALYGAWQSDATVYYVGASNLREVSSGQGTGIPWLVSDANPALARHYTETWPGEPTLTLLPRLGPLLGGWSAGRTGPQVVVWYAGGTDYVNGGSPDAATLYARLGQAAAACRAAVPGVKVVGVPYFARSSFDNTVRNAANALILADSEDYFDAVAGGKGSDVGDLPATIWADGANANTTYFSDGIHATAAGNAVVAAEVRAAIESVLP